MAHVALPVSELFVRRTGTDRATKELAMASAAAKKAAATRKRRAAASKAATTRKRRAAATSTPSVIPMLSYEDGIAALEWLAKAFGFRERHRLTSPGRSALARRDGGRGRLDHARVSDTGLPEPEAPSARSASRPASGRRSPGLSMVCSSSWTTSMRTSHEPKPPVRRSCPTLKRGRPADDIGRRISKATVGSFSRRTTNDAARHCPRCRPVAPNWMQPRRRANSLCPATA